MTKGYIYVLSNPSMPNLYKVGWCRKDPENRASELYKTGVPTPFKIEFKKLVNNASNLEQKIHKLLDEHRINDKREFFKSINKDELLQVVKTESETSSEQSTEETEKYINYQNKTYIKYIRNYFENIKTDCLYFIERMELNDCYFDDERLDKNFRTQRYGTWDSFRRYIKSNLPFYEKMIENIENNWDEIKTDIGIIQLSNDNKCLKNILDEINREINVYNIELLSVL